MNKLSALLTEGEGSAEKLINSPEIYNSLLQTTQKVQTALKSADGMLQRISHFSTRLENANSSLVRILDDDGQLYTALLRTLECSGLMLSEEGTHDGTRGLCLSVYSFIYGV